LSGIFGFVSKKNCADRLLYGIDYHSHMGTEYGGMAVMGRQFHRSIHDISKSQFKSKFYDDYKTMKGPLGIGVISDRDPQPLLEGIEGVYDRIQGSASILILKKEGIYAARDRLGRTPLVIGERNGDYAI